MLLTLNVLSCRGLPPPEPTSISFAQKSGTIGRAADNDLVLPDPENFISRRHAEVNYEGGRYILADTSLSGTVIDDREPLKKSSAELRDGMRIYIGDYELGVRLQESLLDADYPEDQLDSDLLTDIINPNQAFSSEGLPEADSIQIPEEPPAMDFSGDEADPFSIFDDEVPQAPDPLEGLENKPPTVDSFEPPKAHFESEPPDFPEEFNIDELFDTPSPGDFGMSAEPQAPLESSPDDLFPLDDEFGFELPEPPVDENPVARNIESQPEVDIQKSEPSARSQSLPAKEKPPAPERSRAPVLKASAGNSDPLFNVLLESIGINDPDLLKDTNEEDLVRLIGVMFRDLLDGIMTLLRSRAELKNQFRVSVTTMRPVENNPLKFTVTVPDALNVLLRPGQRGYLKPVDAIQNGFNDVSNHQLAMTAGIQASLNDMLKKFDPERFEKQVERGIFSNKEAKCWEAYCKAYEQLVGDAVDDFFGSAFVNAYEKQIQVLEGISGKKYS